MHYILKWKHYYGKWRVCFNIRHVRILGRITRSDHDDKWASRMAKFCNRIGDDKNAGNCFPDFKISHIPRVQICFKSRTPIKNPYLSALALFSTWTRSISWNLFWWFQSHRFHSTVFTEFGSVIIRNNSIILHEPITLYFSVILDVIVLLSLHSRIEYTHVILDITRCETLCRTVIFLKQWRS